MLSSKQLVVSSERPLGLSTREAALAFADGKARCSLFAVRFLSSGALL